MLITLIALAGVGSLMFVSKRDQIANWIHKYDLDPACSHVKRFNGVQEPVNRREKDSFKVMLATVRGTE